MFSISARIRCVLALALAVFAFNVSAQDISFDNLERVEDARVAAVVLGAVTFYLVSNIGMWWVAYPHTGAGLIACSNPAAS